MKLTFAARKPRNPLLVPSRQRQAGSHRIDGGASRLRARAAPRRELAHLHPSP